MDNGGPCLIILWLADPHLLEGGKRGQDGASDPDRVLPLWGSNNLQRANVVNHGQLPRYREGGPGIILSYCQTALGKGSLCGQKGTRRNLVVDQTIASDCQPPSHFIPLSLHEKNGLGPVCFGQWDISRLDIVARNVLQSCKWAHSFVSLLSS